MDLNLNSAHFKKMTVSMSLLTMSFLLASPAHAVDWTEIGDAGQLVGTAQAPAGDGRLRNIYGTISTTNDVDLYRLYISSPDTFSASVNSTSGNLDSAIALFNEQGYALYANDDAMLGTRNAALPAGNVHGPQAPGWYHLAVVALGTPPVSGDGFTPDHYIFSNVSSPYTQILTATGPGGASSLTGWAPVDNLALNEEYRLRLSGVQVSPVPEPETYAMLLAGLGLIGTMVRRRKGFINQL